jgi:hypothetical protein
MARERGLLVNAVTDWDRPNAALIGSRKESDR